MSRPKALRTDLAVALKCVLRFASMKKIEHTSQVEEMLMPAAVALGARRFKILKPGEHPEYLKNQTVLRDWLARLARFRRLKARDRERLLQEVAAWADKAAVTVRTEVRNGKLMRVLYVVADGVQAVVGEVLSRLLDSNAAGAKLISRCPQCGDYFILRRNDMQVCSPRCRVAKKRAGDKARGSMQ